MGFKSRLSKLTRGVANIFTCNNTKRFGCKQASRYDTTGDNNSEKAMASGLNVTYSTFEPINTNGTPVPVTPVNDTNASLVGLDYGIHITSEELVAKYGEIIISLEKALGYKLHVPEGRSSSDTTVPIIEALFAIVEKDIRVLNIPNADTSSYRARKLKELKIFFQRYGRRATYTMQVPETTAKQSPVHDTTSDAA
ncbi:hypothetical protein MFLAVUS_009160 [Mucor flavus]|uniref:Uncharacterized protein n=1 Tax=Mucor flavus TaxID=439312 RepID=A0ABP9Z952_9FUNG